MKKTTILVAMLAWCAAANAQSWGFGPKAGVSFASLNGLEGGTTRTGAVAGVFIDRMVTDWFSLGAELLYDQQGAHFTTDTETKLRIDYVTLPLVSKYYLYHGLNLQCGARFGYLASARSVTDGASTDVAADFNRFNVDFIAGLACDFSFGLILEGRYNIGLTRANASPGASGANLTTGSLQVTAGWRF